MMVAILMVLAILGAAGWWWARRDPQGAAQFRADLVTFAMTLWAKVRGK